MRELLRRYDVPGGALAVSYKGRLVLARGYGLADRESGEAVQPGSLFRIASVSKPITAAAVAQLVEEGRLDFEARAFALLPELMPSGGPADSRIGSITVRDLLQHSGGWNRLTSFDPMFASVDIARNLGVPSPAGCRDVIRYMLARRLDFDPGTAAWYSNFGYCVLGRIIETVSGMSYGEYVRNYTLRPLRIQSMRLGHSRLEHRLPGEVKYYAHSGAGTIPSVFSDGPRNVPPQYGGFYLESMDAHGGWVGSAPDVLRFLSATEGHGGVYVTAPETLQAMVARPVFYAANFAPYYGLGWFVRPAGPGFVWFHGGLMPGTVSNLVRSSFGFSYAVVFNMQPRDSDRFQIDVDQLLYQTGERITVWPDHDLFSEARSDGEPIITAAVNSATFLDGGSPGAWLSIFGTNLAPSTRAWAAADFRGTRLPIELDIVKVKINGRLAPVSYVSPGQLNVLAPELSESGSVWVQVIRNGEPSRPRPVTMRQRAPGLFAMVLPDGSRVEEVRPGTRVLIYATGLAPAPSATLLEQPIPLADSVAVRFGSVEVPAEYAGLIAPGLFQINVVVPDIAGDFAVTVRAGTETSPDGPRVRVTR